MAQQNYPILALADKKLAVPITDGPVYRDAFHGTSIDNAESIQIHGFKKAEGKNIASWYGPGVYFWLHNIKAAIWWAKAHLNFRGRYAVVQCVVKSGWTLQAEQLWNDPRITGLLDEAYPDGVNDYNWNLSDKRSLVTCGIIMCCEENGIAVNSIQFTCPVHYLRERLVQGLCARSEEQVKKTVLLRPEDIPNDLEDWCDGSQ